MNQKKVLEAMQELNKAGDLEKNTVLVALNGEMVELLATCPMETAYELVLFATARLDENLREKEANEPTH